MLKFEQDGTSLHFLLNDRKVYTLCNENGVAPVAFGKGENRFSMSHGSFKIKEKVMQMVPCSIADIRVEGECAEISLSKATPGSGKCLLEIEDGKRLKVSFEGFDAYNRMWLTLPALPVGEYIYGSGELFSEFNIKGKKANVWVAEHINGLQIGKKLAKQVVGIKNTTRKQAFHKYETYYAQPTFISSRKYYFHSTATSRAEFDFRNDHEHIIKIDEIAPFYVGFAENFEGVMENLTALLGRQPQLPDWVYDGHMLGVQGGTKTMLQKLQTAKDNGIPVNGIWIQDWEGRRVTAVGKQLCWNWEWDQELYPDLDKEIAALNEQGIRVLGYINPFLAVEKPLYKEASEKGYLVKNRAGEDYYVTITMT